MVDIEVDFDVYKALTLQRKSETHGYNDVLREMLKLPAKAKGADRGTGNPWVSEGVTFPNGTEFRATTKGKLHTGRIENGKFIVDGKAFAGLSPAAKHLTGYSQNGWKFWSCKRPGDVDFISVDRLRKKG